MLPVWSDLIKRRRYAPSASVFSALLTVLLGGLLPSHRSAAAPLSAPAHTPLAAKVKAAQSSPTAVDLYRLSLLADSKYSYTGRKFITSWREDGIVLASAMLFRHMPPELDSTTYTAPTNARGRVTIEHRRSRELWTYIPQLNVIVHSVQPQSAPPADAQPAALNTLLRNYSLTVAPEPDVAAGRKAYKVTVRSKRANRPYSQLWIDPYTGIVLRRESYRADSSLASVTYFSEIKLAPTLTTAQFSPWQWSSHRPRLVEAHAPGDLVETGTDLDHLPRGYKGKVAMPKSLDGYLLQSSSLLRGKHQTALHLLYTDGLNQISVYETLGKYTADERGQSSETIPLNAIQTARVQRSYTYTVLTWDSSGVEYSIVADLNLQILRHFAAALLQTNSS